MSVLAGGARERRSGFSLLEVVVVLAILGVVAGVSVPALRGAARSDELIDSASEVAALIDRTRRTAADHATHTTLTIDPASARYWVDVRVAIGEREVASGRLVLPPRAELVSRDARVRFSFEPSGRAIAGDLAVRLHDRAIPIVVDPWRGDVRAQ